MFPQLKEMPKCQDGRACDGKNNGFMLMRFMTEDGKIISKFICGDCYLKAKRELYVK